MICCECIYTTQHVIIVGRRRRQPVPLVELEPFGRQTPMVVIAALLPLAEKPRAAPLGTLRPVTKSSSPPKSSRPGLNRQARRRLSTRKELIC